MENYTNEELVGKAMKIHGRDEFVSGKEEFIRTQLSESLSRLGTDYIDLYYMHQFLIGLDLDENMTIKEFQMSE